MIQIPALIYTKSIKAMKSILDLASLILDRRTKDFRIAKEKIMDAVYVNLEDSFKELEKDGIIERCSCGRKTVRKGYKNCICKGSGWINKETKDK